MIKSAFKSIGRMIKPFVNVPLWIGLKSLKQDNQRLKGLAKDVLFPKRPIIHPETYEEAVERLNLTEEMLSDRQKYFKKTAIIYLCVTAAVLIYALYLLLIIGTVLGFMMTVILTSISLSLTFKQHFWYVQMREKHLGLSLRQWFQLTFMKRV